MTTKTTDVADHDGVTEASGPHIPGNTTPTSTSQPHPQPQPQWLQPTTEVPLAQKPREDIDTTNLGSKEEESRVSRGESDKNVSITNGIKSMITPPSLTLASANTPPTLATTDSTADVAQSNNVLDSVIDLVLRKEDISLSTSATSTSTSEDSLSPPSQTDSSSVQQGKRKRGSTPPLDITGENKASGEGSGGRVK
ncbi:hypothetical protein PQX77_008721 [Marasmius sp. AFHP31]|nr:hypothetical protein PQX77_008721 [Marasmius sp. AFHP31]